MADASVSKTDTRKGVWVRLPLRAPPISLRYTPLFNGGGNC